jgi:hypothetical protein
MVQPGTDAVHAERAIKTDRPAFPQAVWFFGLSQPAAVHPVAKPQRKLMANPERKHRRDQQNQRREGANGDGAEGSARVTADVTDQQR